MNLTFTKHAVREMFADAITEVDVRIVLKDGEVIREYPEDRPYPSRLMLAFISKQPIHVVAADNPVQNEIIVITAYRPDPMMWTADFTKRTDR